MPRKKRHEYYHIQLAIIFSLIIAFAYITLYIYSVSDTAETNLSEKLCIELGGNCRTECYANEIPKADCDKNMSCCIQVHALGQDDEFNMDFAIKHNDLSYCNKILSDEMKAFCKLKVLDKINIGLAGIYNDISYCGLISEKSKAIECYLNLAVKNTNPEFCMNIDSKYQYYKCIKDISIKKADITLCKVIIEDALEKDRCIKDVALSSGKISYCREMVDIDESANCVLELELVNKISSHIKCVELTESECLNEARCRPIYFYPSCVSCPTRAFEICLNRNDGLCENSGGAWNILDEECNCYDKVWFKDFGCFHCTIFKEPESIKLCQQRMA
ncbi:MAG: hypothetical protein U9Q69_03035 [Nanoarchaeota archaeon]|nr:hypothetical protein [Nanoarchaeota archaeon]